MNISLGVQWEEFISTNVQSGRYLSASEVVREGLRLLQEREQLRQLRLDHIRSEITSGTDQLDRDDCAELNEPGLKGYLNDVKSRGRQRLAKDRAKTSS
jgi:antitoxin ParD1/3/4